MKGFKSFADNTVLEFEPGVTAVVGPNGSGKSNVVDAVTWVLGAQSTRALRSAKMDDVIFAGTANRAALGRAEVSLTLDNASGRLPVDGAEVTISRTLFRNGDSEYAINGTVCRLLDVQELLGDSGVGRQQHMIIGQGQLDSILNSSSENRRAVIEEAAGVLKHRRRKERAERRLSQTQENLERLGDLVREVRRQMRPLERQAASARSYADVEHELRSARRALFGERLETFERRGLEVEAGLADAKRDEESVRRELVVLDAQATATAAEMASRREELLASTLGQLQGLAERARGTNSVIRERERALRVALDASADENVIATLEADVARLDADLIVLDREESDLRPERDALDERRRAHDDVRTAFEETYGTESGEVDEAVLRAQRDRATMLARTIASLDGRRTRTAERRAETDRASAATLERLEQSDVALGDAIEADAAARDARDAATVEADAAEQRRIRAEDELREGSDVAARTQARAEALARALEELSGSGGRDLLGDLEGVLGSFLDLVDVESGAERAVESAAGASVGAMVVDGRRSARAALEVLRRAGGAGLVLAAGETHVDAPVTPGRARRVRDLVRPRAGAPDHIAVVLDALFARAFVAPDWETGIDLAIAHPDLVIVTADGDRFAASGWRVASGRAVVTRAAVDAAADAAASAAASLPELQTSAKAAARAAVNARTVLTEATAAASAAAAAVDALRRDIERARERLAEHATALAALAHEAAALDEEWSKLDAERVAVEAGIPELERAVTSAVERQRARARAQSDLDEDQRALAGMASAVARREAEFGERRRLIAARRAEIERRLAGHAAERQAATRRRERLEFDLGVLSRLAALVERAGLDVATAQEAMDSTYREQLEASRASAERLEAIRLARQELDARLSTMFDERRRLEVEQAELAVKRTTLHEAIRRDLGVEPHEVGPVEDVEVPEGTTLDQRVGELEARMTSLGPINPLALEELSALEERYQELDAQVADVRSARRELQEVLRALDEEIMQTFSTAVADVNDHFANLIGMLFPGGQGRLLLTEPDDPLNTGVEIEVRPMGRNVRRISLLSGGERSMAALAFLFAVFRSRPSPFYMMDEVEAALDDVNLQRFLSLVDEFRDEAQLLIVTHQKRTMESADALYGVTMVPGASSKVVSQRVTREVAS